MRPSSRSVRCSVLLLALVLLVAASGCSRESRYQVLTFFFTGVPPLDGSPDAAEAQKKTPPEVAAQRAQKRQPTMVFTGLYLHGPYAADDCGQCHELSTSVGFGKIASNAPKKSIVPGGFVLPVEQRCVVCHASKGNAAVLAAGLRPHGPAWNCTICHSPHNGKERYFLRVAASQLCRQCHGEGYIHDADLHVGAEECLECHNPHMGRDARMLRDDLEETF